MYIYGSSGHGKVVAELAEELGLYIDSFIDDYSLYDSVLGYPVNRSSEMDSNEDMVISIGNNKVRKRIAEEFSDRNMLLLVSAKANVSRRSILGNGTVVMMGATINSEVVIGQHCIINTNASVDHECKLEDFVHISPNAALAGNVTVGEGTHIGIGAAVIQNVKIGKWCTIGAGAVVISDVPDYAVVVGNPAEIIKYND